MTTRMLALCVGAAVALMLPGRLESQVTTRTSVTDEATASALVGRLDLRKSAEITKELLEDFRTGLTTELRLLQAFKKELASYPTVEQYRACQQQLASSPEMAKLLMKAGSAPKGTTPEEMNRYVEKMGLELKALLKRKCGDDIEEVDRFQRQVDIQKAAVDAFDAARAARATRPRGPAAGELEPTPMEFGLYDDVLYGTLKDELGAFCEMWHNKLIIHDAPSGQFKFAFNAPLPLADLYTQTQAAEMASFCDSFTDDDLGLLLMYGLKR